MSVEDEIDELRDRVLRGVASQQEVERFVAEFDRLRGNARPDE